MSIGLSLPGTYPVTGFLSKGPSPQEWLEKLQAWLEEREDDELVVAQIVEGPDGPVLLAQLHPFAEELQVACPRTGEVLLTASTDSCGPGYHEHVVELAHAMTEDLGVRWRAGEDDDADDTGFFHSRDRAELERAFIDDLAAAAEDLESTGGQPARFLLPSAAPDFLHEQAVSTPLGPRDAAWLKRVKGGDACVLDALPWNARGRGQEYHLRRGLALAWCEGRWRAPINDSEQEIFREIDRCFTLAREEGATDLPWREWQFVRESIEAESDEAIASRAASASGPLVGYRRGDVVARLLGQFTMRLPGSFSDDVDDEGTWHGTDGRRDVYANVIQVQAQADQPGDAVRVLAKSGFDGEPMTFRADPIVGKGGLRQDDDEGTPCWVLSCGAATGSLLLRATIIVRDDADRDWAKRAFESIRRTEPGSVTRRSGVFGME